MIKDSGERRKFDTGAVRDIQEGKGRCDLLPLNVVSGVFQLNGETWYSDVLLCLANYQTSGGQVRHLYSVINLVAAVLFDDPADMFLEVSKHFEEGAKKYGECNWQKGIPTHCYIDSAVRHLLKYNRGDTDERHDRAFVWNVICCIWTCENKPELNDYARKDDDQTDKR